MHLLERSRQGTDLNYLEVLTWLSIKKKKCEVLLFRLSEHQTQYHRHLFELQSVLATKANSTDIIQHISFLL